jgi:hypothetical protein
MIEFFFVDGYDEMDPDLGQTALKNQVVGLLKAVSYLKGSLFIVCTLCPFLYSFLYFLCYTVPLIIINSLIVILELLLG